jgi:hypothetical protein
MSKYSIYSTKEDFKELYERLEVLEKKSNTMLDWKKIKRSSYDSLCVLENIMKRKLFV